MEYRIQTCRIDTQRGLARTKAASVTLDTDLARSIFRWPHSTLA